MKYLAMLVLLCLVATAAHADESRTWHVLAVAENGTVTILKGLTKHEADFAAARLQGFPATPAEKKQDQDERAAKAEAAALKLLRREERLRKALPACPKDGDPDRSDPLWKQFSDKEKWVEVGDGWDAVKGCVSKDGTIHEMGWRGEFHASLSPYFSIDEPKPWTRHAAMKMVEVFQ